MIERSAGLLLHPTSLPGPFGIGDLGPEAEAFLDWAASAGQSVWQVLPLGPAGYGNPPYTALSAFAGNPLLVSPESLRDAGLLPAVALEGIPPFPADRVDFRWITPYKEALLRTSWGLFRAHAPPAMKEAFDAFVGDPAQAAWLEDWALYAALKARFRGQPWFEWDRELRRREPAALEAARAGTAEEAAYARYVQFLFFNQWEALRRAAAARGIRIMGDLPIYVSLDSADVWAHQRLFALDEDGRPLAVSGVPPDLFSATGQLWGNPLYRWDRMEEEGYAWWIERLRMNFRLADIVRIDHFRGFAAYWEVPAGARDAIGGRWVPGPGAKIFEAARRALGARAIVVEDLGHITEDVEALRESLGFPGMRILQFAFGSDDSTHLPERHVAGAVVYTGTHDNDTTRGWFAALGEEDRRRVTRHLGTDGREIEWDMIRAAYASPAALAIVPLQDPLGLGSEARMNTPGRASGNWTWRVRRGRLEPGVAARLRGLAETTGRLPGGR
jgi:4-alpha-glucanotransferase